MRRPSPRRRQDELAGDDADERIADRELDAGEEMRRRRRQLEQQRGRQRAHAVHARDLGEHARNAVEPVQGRDDHRHDRDQRRRSARSAAAIDRPKIDDHHRIEDEDRHRVIGGEERIERLAQRAAARGSTTPSAKPSTTEIATASDDDAEGARDLGVDLAGEQQSDQRVRHLATAGSRRADRSSRSGRRARAAPIAPTITASLIQPTAAAAHAAISGIAERLHRFAAQIVPQPAGDLAEALHR